VDLKEKLQCLYVFYCSKTGVGKNKIKKVKIKFKMRLIMEDFEYIILSIETYTATPSLKKKMNGCGT